MDPISIVAIVFGIGSILMAAILEGTSIGSLIAPTAFMIIAGGTLGATMACFSLSEVLGLLSTLPKIVKKPSCTPEDVYLAFGEMATLARREGLLVLEHHEVNVNSPLLKRGIRLLVDGVEAGALKDILIEQIVTQESKIKTHASILAAAGGFAPTMGIIGTVLGLVMVLGNLSNADELGPAIAVAFLATLYGISSANLIFLPLGKKLAYTAKIEATLGLMIVEGVLSIQAGDNPRMVQEKLLSLIDEKRWPLLQAQQAADVKK